MTGSVWALPISLAATNGISLISLPRPTQMLHFGQFVLPSVSMGVNERPHSEILGSTVACTYPRLIAACHVLHHLSSRVILQPASVHQQFLPDLMYINSFNFTGIPIWSIATFLSVDHLFFCMTIITSHLLASSFISSNHEEIAYYYSYTIFYTRLSDL